LWTRTFIVLTESNQVFACGNNNQGQLGFPTTDKFCLSTTPQLVEIAEKCIKISCGYSHSVVLTEGNKVNRVYVWGGNSYGQLGLGDNTSRPLPTHLSVFGNLSVIQIVAGGFHTFCLIDNGQIWGCGFNRHHQCAWNSSNPIITIQPLDLVNLNYGIALKISASGFHTGALMLRNLTNNNM